MIHLFEIEDRVVKPTVHCETIKWLRVIKEKWPDECVQVYAFIFYMSAMGQENPYFNTPEEIREDIILEDLEVDFEIIESEEVQEALAKATKLYETPTVRAYKGISKMLDNLSDYMGSTKITHGRDGNISALVQAAKNFQGIRESYKGTLKDLEAEQKSSVRGGGDMAYDQED